jgi:hypothetical protein
MEPSAIPADSGYFAGRRELMPADASPIRVTIVDDNALLREGISALMNAVLR